MAELLGVEDYWVHSVELIMALKEGVIIDMSFVQVDDRLDMNFESLLGKGSANWRADSIPLASKAPMHYLSKLAQATQAAMDALGAPIHFNPLQEFFPYLKLEYGGIHWDRM